MESQSPDPPRISDDWLAVGCAALLLTVSFGAVWFASGPTTDPGETGIAATNPLKPWVAKPGKWTNSPVDAFIVPPQPPAAEPDDAEGEDVEATGPDTVAVAEAPEGDTAAEPSEPVVDTEPTADTQPLAEQSKSLAAAEPNPAIVPAQPDYGPARGTLGVLVVLGSLLTLAISYQSPSSGGLRFLKSFAGVFALATLAYLLAAQSVVKMYNLEYALWALGVGLVISNTTGAPAFLKPAIRTEFYIKTGLVMLGAGVLMSRLLALGLPGVFVAWVVTPIVLISTYVFGQKVLKMKSRSLNMVISADMSVCGVSAAIAAAAACKAKKEELTLAVGMSLSFTVIMMIVLPAVIKAVGMDEVLGGAWLGGTLDATGAVAAAGATLGERALEVAATIKMIQNILIGVAAFGIATYWVTSEQPGGEKVKPDVGEIWRRFPKFVIGFVIASIVFSLIHGMADHGPELVDATIKGSTKTLRGWLFCLAFVCIGLETNFRELLPYMKGGKPVILYVCGQSLNLVLTLFMAWLMFNVVFKDFVQ